MNPFPKSPEFGVHSTEDTSEKIDIVQVNTQLKELTKKIDVLRKEIDKIIEEIED